MLRAILNKSLRQHPTRHQLYGHLPPITKTIQVRRTRHEGHCWRSRDELINDVLLWTSTYGQAKAGRPARTFIKQLCEDTGFGPEDLPEAMNDREKWRERVRDIRASGTTWWWWVRVSLLGRCLVGFLRLLRFVNSTSSFPGILYILQRCIIEFCGTYHWPFDSLPIWWLHLSSSFRILWGYPGQDIVSHISLFIPCGILFVVPEKFNGVSSSHRFLLLFVWSWFPT